MSPEPTWRLATGQRLMHRCHGSECVLFNDLSGDTHLLDASALDLLHLLRDAPQPAGAIAGDDADALPEVEAMLAELAALYLVETVPC